MKDVDQEILSYIQRHEELRQGVDENLGKLYEEKAQRDMVYALQKQISDTMHVLSEEREHYLSLWRENDGLKILKAKQERKMGDLLSLCNGRPDEYVVEDKHSRTQKFLQPNPDFNNKVPQRKTDPRPTSSHHCKKHPGGVKSSSKGGNTALGY